MLYHKYRGVLGNHKGATLVIGLVILAIISLLAVYSSRKSVMEIKISNNMKMSSGAFHTSEAGLNHAQRILMNLFQEDEANQQLIASDPNNQPVWTFLLGGSLAAYPVPATYFFCQGCEAGDSGIDGPWVSGGIKVLERNIDIEGISYTYTVTIWNNNDGATGAACGGSSSLDCDGIIMLRSVAQAFVSGSTDPVSESVLELVLGGEIKSLGAILPGLSQEFANEGKTSSGGDINEITNFNKTSII
ncbi:hypothetical protein MNBD_NITROSPINAE02-431 [hydrothermal vent metagenome]|uniref:Type 4 fimbrial biogenesis protein PilX N-terminal domain-containing protein n=1 Tax=hydrothermal vent metagenome TaxID=652676 RepID=A0A3B1CCG3_9ZZZZ